MRKCIQENGKVNFKGVVVDVVEKENGKKTLLFKG